MASNVKQLDPVQGLVDYVLDIKPYHTKIMEVLVEYVYNEPVDVIISDEHTMQIDLYQPTSGELNLYCDGGYSGRPYGDYTRYPVISPNQSIPFESYPAINGGNSTIIVPGDKSTDLITGSNVYLATFIDTIISSIDDVNSAFIVEGDLTGTYTPGSVFEVMGSYDHDDAYVVLSSVFDGTYTIVTVVVNDPVNDPFPALVPNTKFGIMRTPGNNTGIYTVSTAVYNGGMIDSWPDVSNPLTYTLGDDPHTIVTVLEDLNDLPSLLPNQVYVASLTTSPILIEGALYYSNYLNHYDPNIPTITQTPDEGYLTTKILDVTLSTLDGFGYPIPDTGKFTVGGNWNVSNIFIGDTFKVNSSVGNNGTYTITSFSYDNIQNTTTIGVEELIDDPTVDGNITIDIASNVFIVDGDHRNRFTQGVQFEIISGNKTGTYTTLTSDYVDGKTRIRVISDIFDVDAGYKILSVSNGFTVTGDRASIFGLNVQFNVVGSPTNDGSYIVSTSGASYDIATNTTFIPVDDVIDTQEGGSIHPFVVGMIKDASYGYSESSIMCGHVPETVVSVVIGETLKFGTFGPSTLTLNDDIIAYNLENTDTGGFELPLNTILSTSQPTVPEQNTHPGEALNALWFDTSTNIFKQYNGYRWEKIVTAWWFDTTNNLLYYLTKNKFDDTGWILDFQSTLSGVYGYSQVSPSVGETEYLDDQVYIIDDLGGGVPRDTFTLNTSVPNTDKTLIVVTINNVPAEFTLNNANEFTILSPTFDVDDIVKAVIYDRTATETNARAESFSIEPHIAYHENIIADTTNNTYVVGGGNFINRFTTATHFDAVIEGGVSNNGTYAHDLLSFPILDVDDETNNITIDGDYTWLFLPNRFFKVQTSENNYNEFIVQNSILLNSQTVITVTTSVLEDLLYNPGVIAYNIDNITNTITVNGIVDDAYTVGMVVSITNSSTNNNGEWTVSAVSVDTVNNRTNISVVEDIPDQDTTGQALLHTPIAQNYSRDLGVIWGAVYDPSVTTFVQDDTDDQDYGKQVKTIILPTNTIQPDVTGITYEWVGPLRIELSTNRQNNLSVNILDGLGVSDELIAVPDSFNIITTNQTENYFVIEYTDPDSLLPVDLTDSFTPRTIFDVKGSYSNNTPVSEQTNDAKYVVLQSYFDDPANIQVAVGGETKITWHNFQNNYSVYKNGTLLVEDVDYSITGPNELCFADPADCPTVGFALSAGDILTIVPPGIPFTWAIGSGQTFIQIDTEYDNIPPYNSFNVVSVSNNGANANTITLSGDHATLFKTFSSGIFRLDVPLVSNDQIYNVITVTNIVYDSNTATTILTVQEEFIDEAYTGNLGIIETIYSGDIFYDATNTILPWVDGTIFREAFRIDQTDNTLTATAIDDNLIFGWGTVIQWDIVITDRTANFETFDGDGNVGTPQVRLYRGSISIDGDQTGAIELNDKFSIRGSAGNDGNYEVAVKTYNVGNDDTDITPRNSPRTFEVITNADVAGSLNNTYFFLSTPTSQYYVWMDVDNTGTDPLVTNKIGIEVHVPTDATADTVASNIAYALTKSGVFRATSTTNNVLIDVITSGEPQQYAVDFNTGFVVDNYTLPRQPELDQQGIFELENVDVTNWFQYLIQQLTPTTNEIIINGNATGDVQNGQQVRVIGTNNNDRIFTISALPTYDTTTSTTITPVAESIQYGKNDIVELISSTKIKTLGTSAKYLDGDDIINIVNSTGNDGSYTIVGVEYEDPYSILTISTILPDSTPDGEVEYVDRGGWVEAVRHQGIHIFYEDDIGITATEQADAVVLTTSLSAVDSWDSKYWDIGSFDESLGTVIHLYSNTF